MEEKTILQKLDMEEETILQKLNEELKQLKFKYNKLVNFLQSKKCIELAQRQQHLLRLQHEYMYMYICILKERIELIIGE